MAKTNFKLRILKKIIDKFLEDKCLLKSSELAYFTLLAFIPVVVVIFSIYTKFNFFSENFAVIQEFILSNFLPSSAESIQVYLITLSNKTAAVGFIGTIGMLITSILLLNSVEKTFNEIWGIESSRTSLNKFISFWAILTLSPIFLAFSFYFSFHFSQLKFAVLTKFVRTQLVFIIPFIFTWIGLSLSYLILPSIKISIKNAFIGGAVSSIIWEISKFFFDLYIKNFTSFDKLYGTLGLIPIFLLWLYFTWITVIFGLEVTFILENPQYLPQKERQQAIYAPSFNRLLSVLTILGKAYIDSNNRIVPISKVESMLYLPKKELKQILSVLENEGIVVDVSLPEKGLSLRIPPDRILLNELYKLSQGSRLLFKLQYQSQESKFFKQFNLNKSTFLENYTLLDLLENDSNLK